MASFMSTLGRAFGTISDGAEALSTGVSHLNQRMKRYSENNLRLQDDQNVLEIARSRKEIQAEMLELTKEMNEISKDADFSQSQTWFAALKAELSGGEVASFPAKLQIPQQTVSVRRGK